MSNSHHPRSEVDGKLLAKAVTVKAAKMAKKEEKTEKKGEK